MHDNWTTRAGDVAISRRPNDSYVMLRLNRSDAGLLARIEAALGLPLPKAPNKAVGIVPRVWWTAPGCWLIGRLASLAALETAIVGEAAHVAEIGDGRVVFRVAGNGMRGLLAHGTSLDLHPRVFTDGCCAQTFFAQIPVLIDKTPLSDSFEIHADAAFAEYLTRWFETTIQSFGDAGE